MVRYFFVFNFLHPPLWNVTFILALPAPPRENGSSHYEKMLEWSIRNKFILSIRFYIRIVLHKRLLDFFANTFIAALDRHFRRKMRYLSTEKVCRKIAHVPIAAR